MKKNLSLLIILAVVFSCSSDDSTETELQNEFPENITIADSQSAQVGEILTINGNGFSTNETYIVTFTENQVATITEVDGNYLKVEIPEHAISGSITLVYNAQTKIIGNITIIPENVERNTYIFHNSENKLAKIDLMTGNLTYVGSNIDYGSNTRGAVYHSENNEYIGFENGFTGPSLVRINLTDGSTSTISIPSSFLTNGSDFDDLIIDSNNDVYIFHHSENKLAKIDLMTGNLTYIGSNIDYGVNTRGAVYHSENNEYIGFENGATDPSLVRINLTDGSTSTISIPSSFLTNGSDFDDLIIDSNNDVYIFHHSENKLAKIDLMTGNLTYIGSNIDYGVNTRGAVYHSENNEYIGFENGATYPSLVRINLTDGSTRTISIPSSTDFDDLIIAEN